VRCSAPGKTRLGYLENSLLPGEKAVHTVRPHWIVLVFSAIASLPFGLLGFAYFLASRSPISRRDGSAHSYALMAGFSLAIAAVCLAFGFVRRASTALTITNRRVMAQKGFWMRKTFEVPLSWLATVTIEESLLGRILGYGTILVRGTGGAVERFPNMGAAVRFRNLLQQEWERSRGAEPQWSAPTGRSLP
jgi:uncharacterized membrane protein YdbT with pleckstrin-like domain